jgi:pimeloyl-ACP methyl ester carboxylesterase
MSETGLMSTARAPQPRQSTAIVLVAGLNSANSADVWHGIESDSRLQDLNLRFYRFKYGRMSTMSTFKFTSRPTLQLDDVTLNLYRFIVEISHEERHFVFVGYSLGGIILQKLLTGPGNYLLDRVRLVLLIATPVSERKQWFSGFFNSWSRRFMRSEYLDKLNADWNVLLKQRSVPVVSIVGLRDNIAPYDAGRHWDARNVIVADQDHIGLAHNTDIVSTVLYNRLSG